MKPTNKFKFNGQLPKGAVGVELEKEFLKKDVLFFCEKSVNTNCVVYEANLSKEGRIKVTAPVREYWVMYENNPVTEEELNLIERLTGYGHKVVRKKGPNFGMATITLPCHTDTEFFIFQDKENGLHCQFVEEGEMVEFVKSFLHIKWELGLPVVEYIEMTFLTNSGETKCKRIYK